MGSLDLGSQHFTRQVNASLSIWQKRFHQIDSVVSNPSGMSGIIFHRIWQPILERKYRTVSFSSSLNTDSFPLKPRHRCICSSCSLLQISTAGLPLYFLRIEIPVFFLLLTVISANVNSTPSKLGSKPSISQHRSNSCSSQYFFDTALSFPWRKIPFICFCKLAQL